MSRLFSKIYGDSSSSSSEEDEDEEASVGVAVELGMAEVDSLGELREKRSSGEHKEEPKGDTREDDVRDNVEGEKERSTGDTRGGRGEDRGDDRGDDRGNGSEVDEDDWRSCLVVASKSTRQQSQLQSRGSVSLSNTAAAKKPDNFNTSSLTVTSTSRSKNALVETWRSDDDDSDDDWRKCLIDYDPSTPKVNKSKDKLLNSHSCETIAPVTSTTSQLCRNKRPISPISSSSDSDDSELIIPSSPTKKKARRTLAKQTTKKGTATQTVSVEDLVDVEKIDFSQSTLSLMSTEELSNVTISVYLAEKKLKKDVDYLKKQLRTLPARMRDAQDLTRECVEDCDQDKRCDVDDDPANQHRTDMSDNSETSSELNKHISTSSVPEPSLNISPSCNIIDEVDDEGDGDNIDDKASVQAVAINCSQKHPSKNDDFVIHKSLRFVTPSELALTVNLPEISTTPTPTGLHTTTNGLSPIPPRLLPTADPSFDLILPSSSHQAFFKRPDEMSRLAADPPVLHKNKTGNMMVDPNENGSESEDSSSSSRDEGKHEIGQCPEENYAHPSASTIVFEIDLLILTIVSYLDYETRKRVAVVNSDCYAICSHNISFVPDATTRLPELANRSLYQDNVLVDRNKQFLKKHRVSAVVKVGHSTERVKFQQSAWELCSTDFKTEVLQKFPQLLSIHQKTRADSIPPFAVVPHKALKSTDRKIGDDLDHLIDLSAQIVVLDRQAKIHKQNFEKCKIILRTRIEIGDSYFCKLGKISIRHPMQGKTLTQVCFNKYSWDNQKQGSLTDAEKEKYFFSTGILTNEVIQGRIVLGGSYSRGRMINSTNIDSKKKRSQTSASALVSMIDSHGGISYSI